MLQDAAQALFNPWCSLLLCHLMVFFVGTVQVLTYGAFKSMERGYNFTWLSVPPGLRNLHGLSHKTGLVWALISFHLSQSPKLQESNRSHVIADLLPSVGLEGPSTRTRHPPPTTPLQVANAKQFDGLCTQPLHILRQQRRQPATLGDVNFVGGTTDLHLHFGRPNFKH